MRLLSRIDRSLLPPKVFYFFYYAALVSLAPFLVVYYQQIGLSGAQIGVLTAIPPLVTLFGSPLWGALADATQRHKAVLALTMLGSILAALGMSTAQSFGSLLPIVVIYAFFASPIVALVDNSVVTMLGAHKNEYGRTRFWGAVSWGVVAPLVGLLIQAYGLRWSFYSYAMILLVCLAVVLRMSVHAAPGNAMFWSSLRAFANRRWAIFLGRALIGGVTVSVIGSYLFLHLAGMGGSKPLMGLALTVATLGEGPFWFFSDRLQKRWKARHLLTFSLVLYALRTLAYSFLSAPWQVLLLQLLHGLTFATMWAAGVAYASEIAPPGMGATALGLFGGVLYGLGGSLGAFVGGLLYQSSGTVGMFRLIGLSALLGLALFGVWERRSRPN